MLESRFQSSPIRELKEMYPGKKKKKNDAGYIQGMPDILILYKNQWASLECKRDAGASKRPNQEYYVRRMNEMSFSRFIFPENKKEVLDDLQRSLKP